MPASTMMPDVTVEIAFTTAPSDPAPVWVDVSDYVEAVEGIDISRGRADELSQIQPSTLSLTLDNRDGRFTPGRSGSPYYPNVKKSKRIRVSTQWPLTTGPIVRRFSGYIDEWPLEWQDGTSSVARSRITATSRQARLAKGSELRSIIECEYLQDSPRAYYTFGDPTGTTQAGNTSTSIQSTLSAAPVGAGGGSITFGTATGPGTDDLTACQFTPASASNGNYMRGLFDQPIITSADQFVMIECFFSTTAAGRGIVSIEAGDLNRKCLSLSVTSSGNLAGDYASPTNSIPTTSSAATVTDGATHHACLRILGSGSTQAVSLFLDGVLVSSVTTSGGGAPNLEQMERLSAGATAGAGSGTPNTLFAGVLAHVAVYGGTSAAYVDDARVLAHAQSGLTGFNGERSDQRIARLARYAGVPASEVVTETGQSVSLTNQLTGGVQPIALMQDVVKTEAGNLFDAGSGVLTFQARTHRYNSASSLTLSATLQEIEGGLTPRLDDQGMANDITASRTAAPTMRAVDAASITDYGIYRDDLPLLTTSDNEVMDAAYWNLNQRAQPLTRIPACSVDLLNASTSQKTALLGLELGDKITLTGLPTQAPAAAMDFFVEGIVEKLGAESYDMTLNLSPASLAGVWQLDSATYSVLDSTTRLAY